MHPFEETVSIVGPLVGAIIVLALFFKFMGWVSRQSPARPTRIGFKGILDDKTRATIHLSNGTSFEDACLLGFTDSESIKGHFPYELQGMVILGLPDGRKVLVQAKLIRMIEVPPKEA